MYCYEPELFVEDNNQLPLCAGCRKVPRDAVIVRCGHNAGALCALRGRCQDCVQDFERNDEPQPNIEVPQIDAYEAVPNDNLRAQIAVLRIRCPHQGCIHNGRENPITVAEYDQHVTACGELKLQHPLQSSDNGWFIWPVNNLRSGRDQAMDRVTRAIRSPVFSTSPNGYNLCVILYLDGNDEGLHMHISVYVAIMPGKFDSLLVWPFNQKISVTLRNLANAENNITRVINPQDYPGCFAKPTRTVDMNDKAGFPRFALQSEVFNAGKNFIDNDDDALFFEVNVEPLP